MTSDPKSVPPKEFEPVEDPQEMHRMLFEAGKGLCSAMIWTKDQKHVISSHVAEYDPDNKRLYAWKPHDFDEVAFTDYLAEAKSPGCFFSVSLQRANIFFKADFLGMSDGSRLRFKLPAQVFKVQRRKDLRVPVPDGYVMRVEFEDPNFPEQKMSKKAIDFSAGGLSIVVRDDEAAIFHPGMRIKSMVFSVKGKKITVDGELRHMQVLPIGSQTPGVKVGIQFLGMKPADTQHIAAHVLDESRKYYSKFL